MAPSMMVGQVPTTTRIDQTSLFRQCHLFTFIVTFLQFLIPEFNVVREIQLVPFNGVSTPRDVRIGSTHQIIRRPKHWRMHVSRALDKPPSAFVFTHSLVQTARDFSLCQNGVPQTAAEIFNPSVELLKEDLISWKT